jgi:hypothetical protein
MEVTAMTFWEFWNASFAWIGQSAVIITLGCLIDRRLARKIAALWASYSQAQQHFCESFKASYPSRLRELESQEK